jgi:uncharacterized protein YlaI
MEKTPYDDIRVSCSQCNQATPLDDASCAHSAKHGAHFVCDDCVERLAGDIDTLTPRYFPSEYDTETGDDSNVI